VENKGIILCADDELSIRNLIGDILSFDFSDYHPEFFKDGSSLEKRLIDGNRNIRLVVTDNEMRPGISGSEIIRKYSKKSGFEKIPFILCYAGDQNLGESLVNEGYAFAYFSKPIGIKDFVETIKKALNPVKEPTQLSQ